MNRPIELSPWIAELRPPALVREAPDLYAATGFRAFLVEWPAGRQLQVSVRAEEDPRGKLEEALVRLLADRALGHQHRVGWWDREHDGPKPLWRSRGEGWELPAGGRRFFVEAEGSGWVGGWLSDDGTAWRIKGDARVRRWRSHNRALSAVEDEARAWMAELRRRGALEPELLALGQALGDLGRLVAWWDQHRAENRLLQLGREVAGA